MRIEQLNLEHHFLNRPPALDFVWPGLLAGTVGAVVAPGGTGKSFWALEAAMAVACGIKGGDLLGLAPMHSGRAVYLAVEDPETVLQHRVHSIGTHLDPAAQDAIAERLSVFPMLGQAVDIQDPETLEILVEYCSDARLVILDTLSRIHTGDENSNGEMAQLIGTLEYLAAKSGAAVVFVHHTSKGSAKGGQIDQQHAARGASALIDNARWCGFLAGMDENEARNLSANGRVPIGIENKRSFVRFGCSKNNYDTAETDIWYRRETGGVLEPIALVQLREDGTDPSHQEMEIEDLL